MTGISGTFAIANFGYDRVGRFMSHVEQPAAGACPPAAPSRIFPANLLFLISMVLIVTVGAAAQAWRVWPGMIVTELFCVLLPAWLFARQTRSVAEALRLKWVGVAPCAVGLLIGTSAFPLALLADILSRNLLGYGFSLPDSSWPVGLGGTAVYVLASAILPPLCEEMVFRGYMLGAYERAGWAPWSAILLVAASCTAWHLSLSRAPAVAVYALLVTYLAWRTGSVWPSVGAHLGANGTAALLVIFRTRLPAAGPGTKQLLLASIPAMAVTALCLWRIARWQAPHRPATDSPVAARWGRQCWPLYVAAVVFAVVGGAEIAVHRPRAAQAGRDVRVEAPWTAQFHLAYEIYGPPGRIGEADYHLVDQGPAGWLLSGSAEFRAANAMTGAPMKIRFDASWDRKSMVLRRFFGEVTRGGQKEPFAYEEVAPASQEPRFSGGFYSPYEFPWRLSAALVLRDRSVSRQAAVDLRYAPVEGQSSRRAVTIDLDPQVETMRRPAGTFRTVRLAMGPETSMWYDVKAPYTVVEYRTAGVVWTLAARKQASER
jgi:membrane protease YdiL (CAAX protease family)